jgi:hypothetical protein
MGEQKYTLAKKYFAWLTDVKLSSRIHYVAKLITYEGTYRTEKNCKKEINAILN